MNPPRITSLSAPFWVRVKPEPLEAPYLVAFNPDLGVPFDESLVDQIAGRAPWGDPVALRYAGHQFGVYVPQLGDGRAHLLGELAGLEVQLKGSGRTPFSRGGDGRAVLRSTIREYLASEAMHGLGIPTTRALAIVGSDEPVYRERVETAAILVRMAGSHLRFGSFEMFAHIGRPDLVRELADFAMSADFEGLDVPGFFREVALRTARLVAKWQAVGFTHGVMNTDNMSILGLTLDYGPYAFMEAFDLDFVPNHSDHEGRYAFSRQPAVAMWNLGCLAHALLPLVGQEGAKAGLTAYSEEFARAHEAEMARKLGLLAWRGEDDEQLLRGLYRVMSAARVDYTRFFRLLATDPRPLFDDPRGYDAWATFYQERLARDARDPAERRAAMSAANPKYVLRTHLAQRAIDRALQKDFSEIERLRAILRDPYAEQPDRDEYAHPAPAGSCDVSLSCSS